MCFRYSKYSRILEKEISTYWCFNLKKWTLSEITTLLIIQHILIKKILKSYLRKQLKHVGVLS